MRRRNHLPRGDEAADEPGLHAAFVTHGGELFGFAWRSLGDNGLAEEAVQETFMRAWRSRHRFDSNLGSLRSWLFAIERRVLIDLAHKRSANHAEELEQDHAHVESPVDVVTDIYFRNMSGREVAVRLGVPEGTVRSRLFYALRSLRLVLEEMGWER
jgi:RNA polymerase sigma-70 factor, ECF subfamily